MLYDALVNEALLKLARPGAELIYAGKRRGQTSASKATSRARWCRWRARASACCG